MESCYLSRFTKPRQQALKYNRKSIAFLLAAIPKDRDEDAMPNGGFISMVNKNDWFITRAECPICGSDACQTIYQHAYTESPIKDYLIDFYSVQGKTEFKYLEGATYVLNECGMCGGIFQRDIPNDILMERLYEHWIDPQIIAVEEQKHNLSYYTRYAQEIMQVISFLKKEPSTLSFFDFGMGWGKWALMAKAFGCNSFGTEISNERIAFAKSNGINVITWDQIPNQQFDFINTEQVFEHISQPLETLKYLMTALKPDGILKISVPFATNIDARLKRMDWTAAKGTTYSLNPLAPMEHINFFKRSSLIKMANEAGMEQVYIPLKTQYRFTTDWGTPERIAKNILLPIYYNLFKRRNYIFLRKK
jgi:2-polyprenyl-3-methyl-5-hydroxy-6-metoxy-1,4-benzoquinol methylase